MGGSERARRRRGTRAAGPKRLKRLKPSPRNSSSSTTGAKPAIRSAFARNGAARAAVPPLGQQPLLVGRVEEPAQRGREHERPDEDDRPRGRARPASSAAGAARAARAPARRPRSQSTTPSMRPNWTTPPTNGAPLVEQVAVGLARRAVAAEVVERGQDADEREPRDQAAVRAVPGALLRSRRPRSVGERRGREAHAGGRGARLVGRSSPTWSARPGATREPLERDCGRAPDRASPTPTSAEVRIASKNGGEPESRAGARAGRRPSSRRPRARGRARGDARAPARTPGSGVEDERTDEVVREVEAAESRARRRTRRRTEPAGPRASRASAPSELVRGVVRDLGPEGGRDRPPRSARLPRSGERRAEPLDRPLQLDERAVRVDRDRVEVAEAHADPAARAPAPARACRRPTRGAFSR